MEKETWLRIPGYEKFYSVSSLGRIRLEVERRGYPNGYILSSTFDKNGYLRISICKHRGSDHYRVGVHKLVALAFFGPCPDGHTVNHKNGVKDDNRPENLEYVTWKENVRHSMEVLGNRRDGEHNPAAKMTEEDVLRIRERRAAGESYGSLARAFGITSVMARQIAVGRMWTNVGGPISTLCRNMSVVTLTDRQVEAIRRRLRAGARAKDLAGEYNVSKRTIYNYRDGKTRNPGG